MRHLLAIVGGLLLFLSAARSGWAADVRIATRDGTAWARLIERIQDDIQSDGRVYAIVVLEGGDPVPCGEYELTLDPVAATAFRVEACRGTATELRLVNRAALFEPGEIVPRARTASLRATISRHGRAEGGGAPAPAGSKIWCSVALQPYLYDRLRGQPVPLMPDRFVLRPIEAHIQASPDGSGWIARGESRFSLRFHYDVIDIHTGRQVLENEALLVCADRPAGAAGTALGEAVRPVVPAPGDSPASPAAAPPEWAMSLDIPTPFTATMVASVLVRSLGDVVFDNGRRAASLYGGTSVAVLGGSTLGFSYRSGALFVPVRLTMAFDEHLFAVSGFAGAGIAATVGEAATLYVAPALRITSLLHEESQNQYFNRVDVAALFGASYHLWNPKCHGGWELFAEGAAPLGSGGPWLVSGGITQSWGPGGGYYMSGCPAPARSKGRRR